MFGEKHAEAAGLTHTDGNRLLTCLVSGLTLSDIFYLRFHFFVLAVCPKERHQSVAAVLDFKQPKQEFLAFGRWVSQVSGDSDVSL